MEYLKSDHSMSGEISKKKFEDIDEGYVIKLLKGFLGKNNPNYALLSESSLTKVKHGINDEDTLKYVYSFGASLIQVKFSIRENKKMYFTIELLN